MSSLETLVAGMVGTAVVVGTSVISISSAAVCELHSEPAGWLSGCGICIVSDGK